MEIIEPIVVVSKDSNPVLLISLFYGIFLTTALLSFVNPFFRNLFIFLSVIATIVSALGCAAAYKDKEAGVKRIKPTMKTVFPKWTLHVFFIIMITITAGLKLGYYIIPVCWVITWAASWSGTEHIRATYHED